MKRGKIYLLLLFVIIGASFYSGCTKEQDPLIPPAEHLENDGWVLLDAAQKPLLVVFEGKVQSEWNAVQLDTFLTAPLNAASEIYFIQFLDHTGDIVSPPDEDDHTLGWAISDTSLFTVNRTTASAWAFTLSGKLAGQSQLELQILHSGHVDVRTPLITVNVIDVPGGAANPSRKKN